MANGGKVSLLAISTIAGQAVGEHEWMSDVGEREMTAECRVVGLLDSGRETLNVVLKF